MNIAEAATRSGLPAKTIRYYEEIGLIQPARTANGYRQFSPRDVQRLSFLARARASGFSIDSCRSLMALWLDPARASADVRAIAEDHLTQIDQRIAELAAIRDTLSGLVARCAGDGQPECAILDALAPPGPRTGKA